MADEKPNMDSEVTPKAAVEMKDEDLDQASGGGDAVDAFPTQRGDIKDFTVENPTTTPLRDPVGWSGPGDASPDERQKI